MSNTCEKGGSTRGMRQLHHRAVRREVHEAHRGREAELRDEAGGEHDGEEDD